MLPDRSKRYASPDGEIARLVLTQPWQLGLIAMLVLALLVMIFPHKALVESLYQQEQLDELTLSYIQNLYRTEPNNADVALLLARTQPLALQQARLQETLRNLLDTGTPRQRHEARSLLLQTYSQSMAQASNALTQATARARLLELLEQARNDSLSDAEAQRLADQAFALNQPDLGMAFFERLNLPQSDLELEQLGDRLLAQGQYQVAATYFMRARQRASDVAQARRLFQKSIQTYMQASLFEQAMQAAQAHVGDLASDPQTLRFLARTALAAGQPKVAAAYARQLVFRDLMEVRP